MNDLLNDSSVPAYELEMDNSEAYFETDEYFEVEEEQHMEGEGYDEDAELESLIEGEAEVYEETGYGGKNMRTDNFTERLFELSQFEYESEELDRELEGVLNDIEREYFWAALAPTVLAVAKNPHVQSIAKSWVKKGWNSLKKRLNNKNALQAGTSLLRGNLKGALLPLFRTAVQSISTDADPSVAAAGVPLGIQSGQTVDEQTAALQDLVDTAQEAYEFAAGNLHERVDQPLEATRLANQSLEVGFNRRPVYPRVYDHRRPTPPVIMRPPNPPNTGTRVVRLTRRPGEHIQRVIVLIS